MSQKIKCPECGHSKFRCEATIAATLIVSTDDGELDYQLQEWDYVESAESFYCPICKYEFEGDEKEFLEHLGQK